MAPFPLTWVSSGWEEPGHHSGCAVVHFQANLINLLYNRGKFFSVSYVGRPELDGRWVLAGIWWVPSQYF